MRLAWRTAAAIAGFLLVASAGAAKENGAQPGMAVPQKNEKPARWTAEKANEWYAKQPWLVGSNYTPATASNELEMWQAETFDPKRIDLELGWAESIGLTTIRVFLHDLRWKQDAAGFSRRLDTLLAIAKAPHIQPHVALLVAVL